VNAGAIDSVGWGDQPDLQAHLTAGSVEIFEAIQLDLGRTSSSAARARCRRSTRRSSTSSSATWRRDGRGPSGRAADHARGREHRAALAPALLGAMYSPLRSQADPQKATRAFATLAERRGARC
jgi:glycine/D-amino acid oxidase-like deaminating enzyme